jgi:cytidine deaminase
MMEPALGPETLALLRAARAAAVRSVAPAPERCGAVAATADGARFPGASLVPVDGAGPCACAERIAVWSARAATSAPVVHLALWIPTGAGQHPCGSCLQVLLELAPGAELWMQRGDDAPRRLEMSALMPAAFVDFRPAPPETPPPPSSRKDPLP